MPDSSQQSALDRLGQTFELELDRPAPPALDGLLAEIHHRHGRSIAAILFYGSCLRTERYHDGVLDLYVVVDSYRQAYSSRALVWANAALPPNVFYLEVAATTPQGDPPPAGDRASDDCTLEGALAGAVRCKYAVISVHDFERSCRPEALQSIIWARFCQPAILAYARDAAARAAVVSAVREAALTLVLRAAALLPEEPFLPENLWQLGFTETYRAELRVESPETISRIYAQAPERYDRLAIDALTELERRGCLRVQATGGTIRVTFDPRTRRRVQRGWAVRRFSGKPLAAARLVKSMLTFGDWLPYALWKLERHTGTRIEPTEWQRRHPLLACWPVIFKLLARGAIR